MGPAVAPLYSNAWAFNKLAYMHSSQPLFGPPPYTAHTTCYDPPPPLHPAPAPFLSAWAFGKLKYTPSSQLPSAIAAAALSRLHEFSPQNMSNLAWAFVYMHHREPVLLAALARQVTLRVAEFKPQELANVSEAPKGVGEEMVGGARAAGWVQWVSAFGELPRGLAPSICALWALCPRLGPPIDVPSR